MFLFKNNCLINTSSKSVLIFYIYCSFLKISCPLLMIFTNTIFSFIKIISMYHQHQINGTIEGFYYPISKLHFILVVPTLLAHNNMTVSYYGQVNSLQLKLSITSK